MSGSYHALPAASCHCALCVRCWRAGVPVITKSTTCFDPGGPSGAAAGGHQEIYWESVSRNRTIERNASQ